MHSTVISQLYKIIHYIRIHRVTHTSNSKRTTPLEALRRLRYLVTYEGYILHVYLLHPTFDVHTVKLHEIKHCNSKILISNGTSSQP